MTRADVDTICAAFPGATEAHPPELVSWKVGGKMFACFGGEADMSGVSVKTDSVDTAAMLIDAGAAVRAPYFHKSWVRLPFDATDTDEAAHRLQHAAARVLVAVGRGPGSERRQQQRHRRGERQAAAQRRFEARACRPAIHARLAPAWGPRSIVRRSSRLGTQ